MQLQKWSLLTRYSKHIKWNIALYDSIRNLPKVVLEKDSKIKVKIQGIKLICPKKSGWKKSRYWLVFAVGKLTGLDTSLDEATCYTPLSMKNRKGEWTPVLGRRRAQLIDNLKWIIETSRI